MVKGFSCSSVSKESACNAGDLGLITEAGRSPGGRHGNPFWYSCPENPMDRGAWWATVHRIAKCRTQLSGYTFFLSDRIVRRVKWSGVWEDQWMTCIRWEMNIASSITKHLFSWWQCLIFPLENHLFPVVRGHAACGADSTTSLKSMTHNSKLVR